jgi:hypothetical protein
MKPFTLIACILITSAAFSQKQDTLPCRAMFTEPWSPATNKKVHVSKFYVILKDGKPVKFLKRNRRTEADEEIWDYRLETEGRFAVKRKE